MPRALFCLFSRRDKEAEKKVQAWQKAYSRQGWETSILSHEHGAGFADEIRLGRPRWWPWLAWILHGVRRLSNEVTKQRDFRVVWCGFPPALLQRIRGNPSWMVPANRQRTAFGPAGTGESRIGRIAPALLSPNRPAGRSLSRPRLRGAEVYDLRCGGEKNPYHWLIHAVVPLAVCRHPAGLRVLLNEDPNNMQLGSLRMMGFQPDQILTVPPRQTPRRLPEIPVPLPQAVRVLRQCFGKGCSSASLSQSIYVSRKDANYRRLLDEEKIVSLPASIRPKFVVMSEKTWDEQLEIFKGAQVVCGVHGAAFVFIAFCPPASRLIEMFPEGYERNHFRHLAEICGLHWERIDCETRGRQGRRCREADLRLGRKGLSMLQDRLEAALP